MRLEVSQDGAHVEDLSRWTSDWFHLQSPVSKLTGRYRVTFAHFPCSDKASGPLTAVGR